jgi:hypothetical protein
LAATEAKLIAMRDTQIAQEKKRTVLEAELNSLMERIEF